MFGTPVMRRTGLVLATVVVFAALAAANVEELSVAQIEDELQKCPLVETLNEHKRATIPETTSVTSKIFSVLFPGSPAVNALLATLYISGPPNFLLALCPPNIDPSSLSVMVAFAVGGLLGDTLFHLLPEIFLGEDSPDSVRFVMVEPNRNLLLGLGIMVGFFTFVAMDKTLRIATGGEGHDHSHGPHVHENAQAVTTSSTVDNGKDSELKQRKPAATATSTTKVTTTSTTKVADTDTDTAAKEVNPSVKLGGYLNLIADFTHNITDGLA
ncbi:hypothetical protein LTS12_029358, partial [Elasticomyces elasticus]